MKRFKAYIPFCRLVLNCCLFLLSASVTGTQPATRTRVINMSAGLSAYGVRNIVQDDDGFLWFGTDNGLCRYDGIRIRQFRIPPANVDQYISALTTTPGNIIVGTTHGAYRLDLNTERFHQLTHKVNVRVNSVTVDADSNLWIATEGKGVWRMRTNGQNARHFDCKANGGIVNEVYVDHDNQIWMLSTRGKPLIARLNKAQDCFRPISTYPANRFRGGLRMLQTRSGDFYIGSWKEGLLRLHPNGTLTPVLTPGTPTMWGANTACLFETADGEILLACNEGVQAYNPREGTFRQVSDHNSFGSTSNRFAYAVITDREGGIWYGTFFGGVTYISPIADRLHPFTPQPDGLQGALVEKFCEDTEGRIWIATDDGGLNLYSPLLGRFLDFPARQALARKNVHGLALQGHTLWIGTYGNGIYRMDLATGALKNYCADASFDDTNCYAFYLSPGGELWASSMKQALRYDPAADRFVAMHHIGAVSSDIRGDRQGNIWFATQGNGLWRYDSRHHRWHHYTQSSHSSGLQSDFANSLCLSASGRLLIGTGAGICTYNPRHDRIEPTLLKGHNINGIVAEGRSLWIATDRGLLRYTEGDSLRRFTPDDGLVSNQSLPGAILMASDGQIYIGAVGGFNAFSPFRIHFNRHAPEVFITQLQINNHPVETGSDQLPRALERTTRIDLDHNVNGITLSFAALSFAAPEKNRYAYMLEGFDHEWNYAGAERQATYTNLPAGTYTFRVKAANNDGIWSSSDRQLVIVVHPPLWWSLPAKIFYVCLLALLIYLYTHWRLGQARLQHKREMETERKRQQAEQKEQRLRFFTLVAHEIRTPVSLIIGPLQTVIEQILPTAENLSVRRNLDVIRRNADRLLDLVNQLLDFDKVQHDCMRLVFRPIALNSLIESVTDRFLPTLQQRGIRFATDCPDPSLTAVLDHEAITKVVSNLMSNAMKYTHNRILLSCRKADEEHLVIRVEDNGQGISPDEQKRIFTAFYQAHDNKPGTGIGLSTVQSIVERHHGQVSVESNVGRGACFIVTLPLHLTPTPEETTDETDPASPPSETDHTTPATATTPTETSAPTADNAVRPTPQDDTPETQSVLIVEDDADLRDFIAETIRTKYDVFTAENGREALRVLQSRTPSLVVSDWMMPEMDGEALCQHLRADRNTSHIPFIMLTAKTDDASKVQSMNCGADAFIEKPFSVKYLEACIHRLIDVRRQLMGTFVSHPEVPISTMAKTEVDDRFLTRLREIIENNLDSRVLSITLICEQLGMGRTLFYKKIKALTDCTPNEFIQAIRLKKAAELILAGESKTGRLAQAVGFGSTSYFNKCFQQQFGCTAKEYYAQHCHATPNASQAASGDNRPQAENDDKED